MAGIKEHNLEDVLYAMGDMKKFEILQFFALSMALFPAAFQLFSNVFICNTVSNWCAEPHDESDLLGGLVGYGNNLTVSYSQCEIVVSINQTVLSTHSCLYGFAYDHPKEASVLSQFDLVCDRSSLASLSQTLVIAGQGVGAILSSILSDRFGRKSLLVSSNLGLLICGMVIAFAPNYIVFACFKFLAGAFQQGALTTFYTQFVEMLTIKKRRRQALWNGLMWATAILTLSLIAFLMKNNSWRMLQMVLSLSSLPVFFQLWYGWESLRWLTANNKTKKAVAYLKYGSKLNKVNVEDVMRIYESCRHTLNARQDGKSPKKWMIFDMLRTKKLFLYAIVMWYAWLTVALAFFAIYLSSVSLAGNKYLNFALTAFMEIPATIMLWAFLNRYGRKFTLIFCLATTSVGLIASGIFNSLEQNNTLSILLVITSMVSMAGASGSFNTLFFYTPELFPTNIRNQAVGISSLMGRIGGMIAPFTGVLSDKAKWGPGVLIGCCAFIIAALILFLPETKGRELPQTIDDVLSWSKNDNSRHKERTSEMDREDKESNASYLLANKE